MENLESQIEELKAGTVLAHTSSTANDWLDQRKLRNNVSLSIVGIPASKNEDRTKIVVDLCSAFGMSISGSDLESVYRVAHAKSNMMIIKFKSFDHKSLLLSAKAKKRLTVRDIPNIHCADSAASNPIFVNSHVTPIIGRMLHCGRTAVKEKKILACWITSKGFMVKVNTDGEPKIVHTLEELSCLVDVLESIPALTSSIDIRPAGQAQQAGTCVVVTK